MNEANNPWASPDGIPPHPNSNESGPSIKGHVVSVTSNGQNAMPESSAAPAGQSFDATDSFTVGGAGNTSAASSQYGANRFWGSPGFSDPLGGGSAADSQARNPLQSTATWSPDTAGEKNRKGPGWLATVAVAVAASVLVSGAMYLFMESREGRAEAAQSTLFNPKDKDVSTPEPVVSSTSQNPDWEAVAKAVRPAVVAISVTTESSADEGSGSIIDSEGHILTNNHVVAAAINGNGRIAVELFDGRLYEAEIVGRDVITDLAVIKLKQPPKDLTAVALGDSDELSVGESVAAIGNPLGLSSTVTTGIISALDRPVRVQAVTGEESQQSGSDLEELFRQFGFPRGSGMYGGGSDVRPRQTNASMDAVTTNAIQVDAAVNPGNSGGPLFDAKGRVIGVTSSIASLSDGAAGRGGQAGSIGLGFAIPINQASMVASQLIEHGEVTHAALGVRVTEQVASVGDVSRLGAQVVEITTGSAAAKADLRKGDVIVGINGNQVKGAASLVGWVRQHAVGDTVELNIVREGKEMKVSVSLQAQ